MAEKDEKLLAEFELRMRQLMFFCDSLKSENIRLKHEIAQKDIAIESLTKEAEQLKIKYDNLKFAKSFSSPDSDEMQIAKKRLSKLVRDVDKCIAILKS
ncbi:hypothetical protein [Dysgonomonas sp. ZJ279]|uniref:hypothetical protein n=1 Tax=Dysgonomonas sp. ZJ279 TaxID=2709796 RepID=UPI0013EBB7E2|nr:hypothetical protein [Dysgonomonas sp. ZJ279]